MYSNFENIFFRYVYVIKALKLKAIKGRYHLTHGIKPQKYCNLQNYFAFDVLSIQNFDLRKKN